MVKMGVRRLGGMTRDRGDIFTMVDCLSGLVGKRNLC